MFKVANFGQKLSQYPEVLLILPCTVGLFCHRYICIFVARQVPIEETAKVQFILQKKLPGIICNEDIP